MNKYLEKIAADKDESDGKGKKIGKAFLSNWAGNTAAGVAGIATQLPVANKVRAKITLPQSESGADLHTVRKFMKDNNLHKTTTFNTRSHNIENAQFGKGKFADIIKNTVKGGAGGPAYMPARTFGGAKKDFVVGVRDHNGALKNHDILMHELGHAKDFQSNRHLKAWGGMIAKNKMINGAATVAALSDDDKRKYAPAIAAIPGIATLREEGMANYHAYKGIKAHKGAAAANKYVKRLLPSQMGSYAIGAAVPVAGAYLGKKIMDKWSPAKKKEEEKK